MTRRGYFGGTFDPIHVGHLDVAHAARLALSLDEVVFVPAGVPPHRAVPRVSAAHRFAMVALALQGQTNLSVSDLEMLETGPSYTAVTLDRLAARGIDTPPLFLVVGADAFRDIATWKGYPDLLDRCHFVVVSRPEVPVSGLRASVPAFADRMIDAPGRVPASPSIVLVNAPTAPVSSTDVRRRVAARESIAGLVPSPVAEHIERHQLYRS